MNEIQETINHQQAHFKKTPNSRITRSYGNFILRQKKQKQESELLGLHKNKKGLHSEGNHPQN